MESSLLMSSLMGGKEERSWVMYKIDLKKAYDRVDWGFIQWVLVKKGFRKR